MKILAIETSCDETAIAIADFLGPKRQPQVRVLSHIVSSQAKLHAKFGGVVPNLAKREHQKNLTSILLQALNEYGIKKSKFKVQNAKLQSKIQNVEKILEREPELLRQFKKYVIPLLSPDVDAIAVTYGPGLAPALWVGVNFAKALAYLWNKPLIPVNHMAGHLFSALLRQSGKNNLQPTTYNLLPPQFPALALLVSGGHTQLVLMRGYGKYKIIGETLDDAAGEAFDKVARIMGFPYPGGPAISRLAAKGDPRKYPLPSPMLHSKDYDFSFSGLKTAVFYLIRDLFQAKLGTIGTKRVLPIRVKTDIAASFERATVEVLVKKTIRAAKEFRAKTILLGGGVAANELLRRRLAEETGKALPSSPPTPRLRRAGKFQAPSSDLCGDNALMIATAAYFSGKKMAPIKVGADANARLERTINLCYNHTN